MKKMVEWCKEIGNRCNECPYNELCDWVLSQYNKRPKNMDDNETKEAGEAFEKLMEQYEKARASQKS